MNAYLGQIAARAAGMNAGLGVPMVPLRPTFFPISTPFPPGSTIPLSTGETLESANPAPSPTSQGLDSRPVESSSREAASPPMAGHGAADAPNVMSGTASPPAKPSPLYESHPEGLNPRNPKVTTRQAGRLPDESVSGRAGLTGSRGPASAPELSERKPEVELNPEMREMQETSPGIRQQHPVRLNETRADNTIQPVGTNDGTAGRLLRPAVRLEPGLQRGTSRSAEQLSAAGAGQDNIFETGDLPNFPARQKGSAPTRGGDARVIIGQVNMQVETVKPSFPAPKAPKSQPDPFAPLTLARRGWRGFFGDF